MNAVGMNAFPETGEALRVAGGVARFDDGIVLVSNGTKYLVTISGGSLKVTAM